VVVPIDDVIDLKAKCYAALESQFMEWNPWLFSYENEVPEGAEARLEYASKKVAARQAGTANRFRAVLAEELGQEAAGKVRAAEAFELCEYGAQPSKEELRKMFPLPKQSP
jgi:hypothetical protein